MPIKEVESVEEFPPLVRGASSRNREEKEQIMALIEDGKKHRLLGIEDKKEYDALQQRIRNIAKAMGVKVKIQYGPSEGALYLTRIEDLEGENDTLKVDNEVESTKEVAKASKTTSK